MKKRTVIFLALLSMTAVVLISSTVVLACGFYDDYVRLSSEKSRDKDSVVAAKRSAGYSGLREFAVRHAVWLTPEAETRPNFNKDQAKRIRDAYDKLCAQRDCMYSHLFWHTDFSKAVSTAKAEKNPILSFDFYLKQRRLQIWHATEDQKHRVIWGENNNIELGEIMNFTIQYRGAVSKKGVLNIWKDGEQIVGIKDQQTAYDDAEEPYWRFGAYYPNGRPESRDPDDPDWDPKFPDARRTIVFQYMEWGIEPDVSLEDVL